MSVLDRFFDGFNKKSKAVSAFEEDTSGPPANALPDDEKSPESFLDTIGDLAIRQRVNSLPYADHPGTDLTNVSLKDFPEIESTEQTLKK
jgi:hypothetical protein